MDPITILVLRFIILREEALYFSLGKKISCSLSSSGDDHLLKMERESDQQLLHLYLSKSSGEAFRTLVDRHLPLVHSVARRVTANDDAASDVAQKIFIKLVRRAALLPSDLPLTAWLHRETHSASVDYVRREVRRQHRERVAAELTTVNTEREHWDQISTVIDQAINSLSKDDRAVVLLRFYENRSHPEVAQALGISGDAARMRTKRALEKLRGILAKKNITTSGALLAAALPAHAITTPPIALGSVILATATAIPVTSTSSIALFSLFVMNKIYLTVTTLLVIMLSIIAYQHHQISTLKDESRSIRIERSAHVGSSERTPQEGDERQIQPQQNNENKASLGEDFIDRINAGEIGFHDLLRATAKYFAHMEPEELKILYSKTEAVENLRFKTQLKAQLLGELSKRGLFDEALAMAPSQPGQERYSTITAIFGAGGMDLKTFSERLSLLPRMEAFGASGSYFDTITRNGLPDLGDLVGVGKMNRDTEKSLLYSLRNFREQQVKAEFNGQEIPKGNIVKFTERLYKSEVVSKETFLSAHLMEKGNSAEADLKKLLQSEDLSSAKNFKSVTESFVESIVLKNPSEKMGQIISMATSAEAAPNNLVESGFTSWLNYNAENAVEWYENRNGEMSPHASDEIAKTLSDYAVKTGELDTAQEWVGKIKDPEAKASAQDRLDEVLLRSNSEKSK